MNTYTYTRFAFITQVAAAALVPPPSSLLRGPSRRLCIPCVPAHPTHIAPPIFVETPPPVPLALFNSSLLSDQIRDI